MSHFYSLYPVLGLPRTASPEEIKFAYRTRCRTDHPDKNPEDKTATARFQKIEEAYSVLSDPVQRQAHDKRLSNKGKKAGTIVVFGQTGVGKSSLINELVGSHLIVSNKAVGCTFQTEAAEALSSSDIVPIDFNGTLFLDTAGLGESDNGTVPSCKAIQNLIDLILSLTHGISLMIFVVDYRLHGPIAKNYKLFVETIAEAKVPCMCVVTGLDMDAEDTQTWTKENKQFFEKEGMDFKVDLVGVSLQTDKKNTKLEQEYIIRRKESRERVWNAINQCMAPKPVFFPKKGFLERVITIIKQAFGKFSSKFSGAFNYLIELGLPQNEAKELAEYADQ